MLTTKLSATVLLACSISSVFADVSFTSPKAGAKLTGGTAIEVEWKDSGSAPSLTDLSTYQLFLCAGGNDAASIIQLAAITTAGTFTAGNKATGTIGIAIGASSPDNAYFLKMVSTAATGGTVTNYSPRFSLSGMTGTFPDTVIQGLKNVKGNDGPDTVNAVNNAANPAAGDYGVAYTLQTGPTKYAPMQKVPPTKITKKSAVPQYPTSSFNIVKSALPPPKQQTTITQSQTFSVASRENPATPAPMPSDDMAKFLARWKD